MVLRPDGPGRESRVGQLVARRIIEAHREGANSVAHHGRHQARDNAGVEPAGEK